MNPNRIQVVLALLLLSSTLFAQAISPYLTGVNVWYNPNDAVWAIQAAAGHKIIRIGGHAYDDNMPSNAQLTTWVNKIKAMGAEPLIQVSQYQSAAAAAAIVRYFNVETNNPVKFWGIGNEPWLQADKPAMNTMPARIAAYIKPAAIAMRDVDPSIQLYVVNECYFDQGLYTALFNSGTDTDIGGKDPKGRFYVNGASWHRYNDGGAITGADDIINSMRATETLINAANTRHNRTGADKLGWGIGEFNANAGAGAPCSFGTGQMVAAVYGGAMRYGATFATMWSMQEGGSSCTGTDFGTVGGDMKPRATLQHMQLVAKNMSGTYAHGTTNMGANIFPFASKSSQDIAVMIINRGAQTYNNFTLRLDQQTITGNGVNINAGVNAQHTVSIGANTTLLLVFSLTGVLNKRMTYTTAMYAARTNPQVETINDPDPPVITYQAIPGKIEAEFYSNQLGVETETTTDAGGGLNVGWMDAGDWMEFSVDVATGRSYQVTYRVASTEATGEFALKNASGTILSQMTIPQTTGWQNYVSITDTLELTAGKQTLRLEILEGPWNLNWLSFEGAENPVRILQVRKESEGLNSTMNTNSHYNVQGAKAPANSRTLRRTIGPVLFEKY